MCVVLYFIEATLRSHHLFVAVKNNDASVLCERTALHRLLGLDRQNDLHFFVRYI